MSQYTVFVLMSLLTITVSKFHNVCIAKTEYERFQSIVIEAQMNRKQILHNNNVTICKTQTAKPIFPNGEPQKWVKIVKRNVYVFSAFYEQRKFANGPSIRVIACGLQEELNVIGDMYCHLWYDYDIKYTVVVKAEYHRIYRSHFHGDMYVAHFIICPLPRMQYRKAPTVPYALQILAFPCVGLKSMQALMVLNRNIITKKGGFATCISPLYNYFQNYTMIAEMFELHALIGAEEITIYKHSAGRYTSKVLQSFVKDKAMKVNVVMWESFPKVKDAIMCQRGALNDCVYRTGMKYEFVSVADLDEINIPRMVPTLRELFAHIAKPKYGAYMFQHAYFRRNYSEQAHEPLGLISQSSFWRTDVVVPAGKVRCKTIYRSAQAVSVDLHFPYVLVPGALEYLVPPNEGMLHHYRSTPMEYFRKYPENYRYIEDRHMEIYKRNLSERVRARLEDTFV